MTTTVIKHHSDANDYLKKISIRSIKDAGSSGGGSSSSNSGSGGAGAGNGTAAAGSVDPAPAVIKGGVALGSISNANITAYDEQGNVLSQTTAVVDGKYSLTLNRPFYKGKMLLVVRDNTPGVADNYIDEGTFALTDLGTGTLRALVNTEGTDQNANVTALTELAVLKAGLEPDAIRLATFMCGKKIWRATSVRKTASRSGSTTLRPRHSLRSSANLKVARYPGTT